MDTLDEIRLRMKFTNLEARLALREIDSTDLLREIKSPLTNVKRMNEARERLDAARSERGKLITELDTLRRTHPNIHH